MKQHQEGTLPSGNEIFVFGSNLAGRHGAGAALIAMRRYDAQYGVGEGITGNSYGIPTKDAYFNVLSLETIENNVSRFLEYAIQHPEKEFFVTGIGCGFAGYTANQIAPFFKDAPNNVSIPDIFYSVINGIDL